MIYQQYFISEHIAVSSCFHTVKWDPCTIIVAWLVVGIEFQHATTEEDVPHLNYSFNKCKNLHKMHISSPYTTVTAVLVAVSIFLTSCAIV